LSGRLSDNAIIEGVRQQDDKVLTWMYNNYHQAVRHHVLKNNGTEDDVSDVFQESIIILYSQITGNTVRLTGELKGYFFGIARNVWSSMLRKKLRITAIDSEIVDESTEDDPVVPLLERIIFRSFQKLKPDARNILTLYSEGLSYDEIATRMDLKNEGYARRKKYLSKEALIEIIKEDPEYGDYLRLIR
jgi:RNA polymerase sigma factor (sigma-70 family)